MATMKIVFLDSRVMQTVGISVTLATRSGSTMDRPWGLSGFRHGNSAEFLWSGAWEPALVPMSTCCVIQTHEILATTWVRVISIWSIGSLLIPYWQIWWNINFWIFCVGKNKCVYLCVRNSYCFSPYSHGSACSALAFQWPNGFAPFSMCLAWYTPCYPQRT